MSPPAEPTLSQVLAWCRPPQAHPGRSNILSTLIVIQEALGAVPPEGIPEIARALNVTEADVTGVLSYYPELRTARPGRHVIRVCHGESCVANHGGRVLRALQERLQTEVGRTTADGRFTLQQVYCVGNCAVGPTVMVGDQVHGRVMPSDLSTLLDEYK